MLPVISVFIVKTASQSQPDFKVGSTHSCKLKIRFLGDAEVPGLFGKNSSLKLLQSLIVRWFRWTVL